MVERAVQSGDKSAYPRHGMAYQTKQPARIAKNYLGNAGETGNEQRVGQEGDAHGPAYFIRMS
ncbi:hypothetical protein Gbth_021_050 [Gluconobacter thailandicus F149-1 = NBRC 100600]|nr:hypothetical protein Gbfr_012_050 [Gluconobacter frateurii M-2]GAN93173.1 hypothetical protein Gbth_021_050 [Gluconobacter thailandicus F149-1 = NBRC 100600]GEL86928.1 hypothetical protein GTH01_12860 [Gluconobacter thailandicus F149-1 = NBRC 100600]